MTRANLLQVRDLTVHAGATPLLHGVSFELRTGQCLAVLGESGAGKSLMAQAIMGTLPHPLTASGAVAVDGHESAASDMTARRPLWGNRALKRVFYLP